MQARDLMSSNVLTVTPDTPVQRVAQLLIEHGISAVPVVEDGEPVGIISETDLVARAAGSQAPRVNWCTRMLAGQRAAAPDFSAKTTIQRTARDVMSAPLITVAETASAGEAVQLMATHGIKRLPVVRGGRMVGIISRADLLRAIAAVVSETGHPQEPSGLSASLTGIDKAFHGNGGAAHAAATGAPMSPEPVISAKDFRAAVAGFKQHAALEKEEARRLAAERHKHEVEVVLGTHITEDVWRHMLLGARRAAENGENEFLALRIPREACSDNGRAINMSEAGWASTLRGEAAELWLRWSKELQPRGFRLTARTLEYPDGIPGDIGLFLAWGG